MKPLIIVSLSAIVSIISGYSNAYENVPSGFESFYELKYKQVKLRDPNGNYSTVNLETNQNHIRLSHDNHDRDSIRETLLSSNINQDTVGVIVSDLQQGIDVDFKQCSKINISKCTLLPDEYEFLFDNEKNLLLLFVNPKRLNDNNHSSQALDYYQPYNPQSAIINHLSLNADKFSGSDASFRVNDEVYANLGYGYLHADMQYQSVSEEFDLYTLAYHLDVDNMHVRAGQFRSFEPLNSTDFLRSASAINGTKEIAVEIGSSKNLLRGKSNQSKVLYYYAPAVGRVVVRDTTNGRYLVERNTEQGQRALSYSELPYGVYEVEVEVRNGEQVLSRETHTIFNNLTDDLAVNDVDYALSAGTLESNNYWGAGSTIAFGRGLFSTKLHHSTLLGTGLIVSDEGQVASGGLSVDSPWNINFDTVLNYASTHERHFNATVNVGRLGLSYQRLRGSDENNLASTLFGYGDYERWYVNYGYSVSGVGFLRFSGSYSQQDSETTGIEYESTNLNTGLSSQLNSWSRINVDLGYQTENVIKSFDDGEFYGSISLSLSLGTPAELTWNTQLHSKGQGIDVVRNSLTANRIYNTESTNVRGYAGHTYQAERGDYYDASLSGQYDNDRVALNGYLTADSNNYNGGSIGFKTSTIMTDGDLYHSSTQASSYAVVDLRPTSSLIDENEGLKGHLMVEGENGNYQRHVLYRTSTAIPLSEYGQYQLDLDTSIADLHNVGERYVDGYSFPGGVVKMDANIGITKRLVAGFTDIFNRPIQELSCKGIGCVDVTPLVDGVFNITVLNQQPFHLVNDDYVCDLNVQMSAKVNYGNNYCFPSLLLGQIKRLTDQEGNSKVIQYLGDFHQDSDIAEALERLSSSNIMVYLQEHQFYSSIYITYEDQTLITMDQADVIESLLRFARTDESVDLTQN
ncbi:TcfC E-set like domain-containing protein [Vibrio hippocampi]|uniref:Pilus assembly protein E-set like domain-containing protein n=1 Tax=Vibrio hippocampi TaxID=654686 RepID=A0ABN8DL71_9VIBR|nr:TcfC E-set like domain-containing protein [Vibrio hippocampi]CAH0527339.1 hypothetical protein VHP8226_02659 [Vibrio hippocampi]